MSPSKTSAPSAKPARTAPPKPKTRYMEFTLRGDFITLDALLKATAVAHSGGAAKQLVAEGEVCVDGQPESRKTCKIRAGQRVSIASAHAVISVHADPAAPPETQTQP